MRKVKFRAWDEETKEMSYDFLEKNWLKVCIESPYVELMQFTGLKDKNGKEIYEGDIVENNERWLVVHAPTLARFMVQRLGHHFAEENMSTIGMMGFTVIGNRYENIELLNKN